MADGDPFRLNHTHMVVSNREHLAWKPCGQAGEVESAGRFGEAERVAPADDQQPHGIAPQAEQGQGAFRLGHGPGGPLHERPGPAHHEQSQHLAVAGGPGPQAVAAQKLGVVADDAVVDQPAAAGRVGMVVAVVLGIAMGGPAAMAHHGHRVATSVQVVQAGRGCARALEGPKLPLDVDPRQAEGVAATGLRLGGDPAEAGQIGAASVGTQESKDAAHGGWPFLLAVCVLGHGVVLLGQAAELGLDLVLGDGVRNPSVLLAPVNPGVAFSPGQVAQEAFRLALARARLLPAPCGGLGVPGRHPLGRQGPLDQPQADLDPANNLGRVERAGEHAKLDRVLVIAGEIGEVQGVMAIAVQAALGLLVIAVFPHPAAVPAALAVLGTGDGVEALFQVGDDGDQPGQGLAGPIALPPDVDVDAAGGVYAMALGLERFEDLDHLADARFVLEHGADDLALMPAVPVVDRTVVFGLPTGGQVGDLHSMVTGADPQAVVPYRAVGGDRFNLDSEGQFVGVHGVPLDGVMFVRTLHMSHELAKRSSGFPACRMGFFRQGVPTTLGDEICGILLCGGVAPDDGK